MQTNIINFNNYFTPDGFRRLVFLYCYKINFCAKSQQKNYSTENKVIGNFFNN